MFNETFYPTDRPTIEKMVADLVIDGKVFLEPEGGKGDIVDYLKEHGAADVIACEINKDLQKILQTKCRIIADDFLTVTSEQISHIDAIVMNPPFDTAVDHILHAYNIAPPGCKIRALCNYSNIQNDYTSARKQLNTLIEENGESENIGPSFAWAERKTKIDIGFIKLDKPGGNYNQEFSGFFMDDDPQEQQSSGIMSYNAIRELVNRYVAGIKLFDEQMETGIKMHALVGNFYHGNLNFTCSPDGTPKLRKDFKKELQMAGWKWVLDKMNMKKYATRGLYDDINKFVNKQMEYPFTMKNIYHMLDVILQTTGQRMDKAILEVFDKLTEHHHDNRKHIEGWKTNSHFLVNRKFILPGMCWQDQRWYKGESKIQTSGGSWDFVEDLVKALCFITGENWLKFGTMRDWIYYPYKTVTDKEVFYHHVYDGHHYSHVDKKKELYKEGIGCEMVHTEPKYGEWFDWAYFRCKAFKKGSMHFEFKDPEVWAMFNQRVAKLKGYPLFEGKEQTAYQDRQTGRPAKKKPGTSSKPRPATKNELIPFYD